MICLRSGTGGGREFTHDGWTVESCHASRVAFNGRDASTRACRRRTGFGQQLTFDSAARIVDNAHKVFVHRRGKRNACLYFSGTRSCVRRYGRRHGRESAGKVRALGFI
jgi:hypothetical protein